MSKLDCCKARLPHQGVLTITYQAPGYIEQEVHTHIDPDEMAMLSPAQITDDHVLPLIAALARTFKY